MELGKDIRSGVAALARPTAGVGTAAINRAATVDVGSTGGGPASMSSRARSTGVAMTVAADRSDYKLEMARYCGPSS